MRRAIDCVRAAALVALGAWSAAAGDWTGFQGPLPGDIDPARLPTKWTPEDVRWSAEIVGYGQSSPVTWGSQVYVTSISGPNKQRGHVAAFDLATGRKLWQHDLDAASQAENNNYVSKAAPSPVADADGLVCLFEGGNLLALSHAGDVRWQRNLVEEFGAIESRHGLAASLEQSDQTVFVWIERQNEPYVLAVDKRTGRDRWKAPGLGATSWASPRLVPVEQGRHLVLSGIGKLAGLDPESGRQLWQFDDIQGNSTPTPVPVGGGRFLIGATVGRGDADSGRAAESNGLIAIRKTDAGEFRAEFVWRAKRATSSFGSPAATGRHAYFISSAGVLYCLDLATGAEQYAERLGDSAWATPLVVGDRLWCFGKSGRVLVVAAGDTFEKLAENAVWPQAPAADAGPPRSFGGPVLYAAALAHDRLLLRRGDRLYCVGK